MVLKATKVTHSTQPCGSVPRVPVLALVTMMTTPAFTLSLSPYLKSNVFTHQFGALEPKLATGLKWKEMI